MAFARDLDNLGSSTQHLLHTVAALGEQEWRDPSLLPGWSRAHVVAHLVLNAQGFARAIEGLVHDQKIPVYDSQESRDADIVDLAGRPRSVVREHLEQSTARLATALSSLGPEHLSAEIARLPDGPCSPVSGVPRTRRREVEVHHADLGSGYRPTDWPVDFCRELLDDLAFDRASLGPIVLVAEDGGQSWQVGAAAEGGDSPTVHGPAGELGWWLAGRGDGTALRTEGSLPDLGRWR